MLKEVDILKVAIVQEILRGKHVGNEYVRAFQDFEPVFCRSLCDDIADDPVQAIYVIAARRHVREARITGMLGLTRYLKKTLPLGGRVRQ
jgi:hypothetical protein